MFLIAIKIIVYYNFISVIYINNNMLNNMNFYKNENFEEKHKYTEITYNEAQEQFIIKGRGSFTIPQVIKFLCKDIDNNFLQHVETGESELIIMHAIGNIKNGEFNMETPFKYNIELLMKLLLLLDLYTELKNFCMIMHL